MPSPGMKAIAESSFRKDRDNDEASHATLNIWGGSCALMDIVWLAFLVFKASRRRRDKELSHPEELFPMIGIMLSVLLLANIFSAFMRGVKMHVARTLLRAKNCIVFVWASLAADTQDMMHQKERYVQTLVMIEVLFPTSLTGELADMMGNQTKLLDLEQRNGVLGRLGANIFFYFVIERIHTSVRRAWILQVHKPGHVLGGILSEIGKEEKEEDDDEKTLRAVNEWDRYYSDEELLLLEKESKIKEEKERSVVEFRKTDILLGSGSFGSVYRAVDCRTSQHLAVKTVPLKSNDENDVDDDDNNDDDNDDDDDDSNMIVEHDRSVRGDKELMNELSTMKKLSHRNIVCYLGTEIRDDELLLVMEYCAGGSLASILHGMGAIDENIARIYTRDLVEVSWTSLGALVETVELTGEMCQGLNYLHRNYMVHRDIKSSNCLLSSDGVMKLADFGATKSLNSASTNDLQGTPGYMAPEVLWSKTLHRQSDVWSLGCCVLEMLTLELPYGAANYDQQLQLHYLYRLAQERDDPHLPGSLSEDAREFIKKCLRTSFVKGGDEAHVKATRIKAYDSARRLLGVTEEEEMPGEESIGGFVRLPRFHEIRRIIYNKIDKFEGWSKQDSIMMSVYSKTIKQHKLRQVQSILCFLQPIVTCFVLYDIFSKPFPEPIVEKLQTLSLLGLQVFWNYFVYLQKVPLEQAELIFSVMLNVTRFFCVLFHFIFWNVPDSLFNLLILTCASSVADIFPTNLEHWMWIVFLTAVRCLRIVIHLVAVAVTLHLSRLWRLEDKSLFRKIMSMQKKKR
ncbi:hypothetical protein GUITHDRAFT_113394 [Guillardia theta CCMP2712]|uniref:Protein kinase domain-containing protein n=1 Tax=Guillardia theta (strain CCMP2712) TaxID=905079 RepID=L1IWG4_GUITC|nr:hypothetical protein GUITHDRAFT_113394 [Guillardia theta CCMP2712]EKX40608.1 hypothetical protein GUITHDRAFT_113394 [Guillardia theta CCMP2712]|eukprot:XP_005827588.1 hypothetical protein GUITHDRAFT_113394 [Guillardia theta CCMP2712]